MQDKGARRYSDYGVTIRMHVCAFIQMYNTDIQFSLQKFDELFLRSIILEVFRRESILQGRIDEKKMEFVKLLFGFHTKGKRLDVFKSLAKKVIHDLYTKYKQQSENSMNTVLKTI